jgi:hypothetical protein
MPAAATYNLGVRVDPPDLDHLEVEPPPPAAISSPRRARRRWLMLIVALGVGWAVIVPALLALQVHDLRRQVRELATGEPDFCLQHPLTGRIHFSHGQVLGDVGGLPPNTLIDAKWVANATGGAVALQVEGRTDSSGRLRMDGPSFGAEVVGTMLTIQVAPNGGFYPPAFVC